MIQIQMRKNVWLLLMALLCAVSFWSKPAHALPITTVEISTATATYNSTGGGFNVQMNWSVAPMEPPSIVMSYRIYILPNGTTLDSSNLLQYGSITNQIGALTSWTSSASIATDSSGTPLAAGNYNAYVVANVLTGSGNVDVLSSAYPMQLSLEPPLTVSQASITTGSQTAANPTYAKVGDTANVTFTLSKAPSALPTVRIVFGDATVSSVGNNVYKAQYTFTGSENAEGTANIEINVLDGTVQLPSVRATTDSSSVFYDKTNPTGSFTINNGADSTNTTSVTLNIAGLDTYIPHVYSRSRNVPAFAGTAAKPILLASADQSVWSIQGLLAGAGPQPVPGSGVDKMQFSNDNVTWSGWEPFSATKSWTLADGDGTKTVYMRLIDKAGNELTQVASATILLQTPPTITPVTITSSNSFAGYAKVGDTVTLTFSLSKPTSLPLTATIMGQDVTVTSTGNNAYTASYTFTNSNYDGNVWFSIDLGSNPPAVTEDRTTDGSKVIFDRTAPTVASFVINDGAATTDRTAVTLTIDANDIGFLARSGGLLASADNSIYTWGPLVYSEPVSSGLARMQFSNDNVNWSGWEPFSATKSWTLTDGDGMKTVYMRLIDNVGNELTQAASASIMLQTPLSVTPVTMTSSNSFAGYAKVGDTATLTFSLSKPTNLPLTASIAGHEVTVTSVSYNVYTASYTFTDSSYDGQVRFSIDVGSNPPEVTADRTTDGSKVIFDKTAPTATTLVINGGAATTTTTAVTLTIDGKDIGYLARSNGLLASADNSIYAWGPLVYVEPIGSGLAYMQFSNDGVNWSDWEPYATTKAWTLSNGNGTKTVYMKLKDAVGNEMTTPYTATIDLQLRTSSNNSGSSYSPTETITVNVENGVSASGSVVSKATINRTTDANGRKTDAVTFTLDQANKTVEQLQAAGSNSARIVIPDSKDEVSEVQVTIPKASTDSLVKGNVGVEISTANGRVDIPKSSLEGFADDIYFRFVPIKTEGERKVVEDRAKKEQEVRLAVGNDNISIVGRPMTIETNLQSRPVTLTIPLGDTSSLTEQQLQNLGVFIEHSDGTKEFVKGQIVKYDDSGKLGIQFTVTKFSTFTVVKTDGSNKTTHKAYINGYPDGTFGPEKNITRAEMASLLVRVSNKAAAKSGIAYTDVASSHWAKDAIEQATRMGLMEGYNGGSFKPEQTITRAEMAAILSRISGNSASGGDSFKDVNGHWAQSAVAQAKATGYIDGYADGTFRPEQTLTRAEAVTMINKLLGRGPLSGAAAKWSDVSGGSWAFEQIQEASIDHTSGRNATGGEQWVTTP